MAKEQFYRPRLTEEQVDLIIDLLWYRDARVFGTRHNECVHLRHRFLELKKH